MLNKFKSGKETPIQQLQQIVSKLRDPRKGCPWDIKQNHLSLIPYAIEEAHEVADAIRNGNDQNLCDELGDLLLQVVMHAQIAHEEKRFGFDDIAKAASQKMVRRHPHVFDKRKKISIKEVSENWEKIKQLENKESNSTYPISQELRKKIRSQSAFHGSISISKKSLKNGLNLNKLEDPWGKINEDIFQLKNALSIKNQLIAKHKIGSLICSLINISHQIGIDPEEGIRKNNQEFLTRLQYLESNSHSKSLRELPMLKLKSLWENSKESISQENY